MNGAKAFSDEHNQLFFGDSFNSKRDYKLLFKTPEAPKPDKTGKRSSVVAAEEPEAEYSCGEAQITAFEDTCH